MIEALLREYPHLDRMMAETLVNAYEKGTLDKYMTDHADDAAPIPEHQTIKGSIVISDGQKNVDPQETQCVVR